MSEVQLVQESGIFCHKHMMEHRSYDVDFDEVEKDRKANQDVKSGAWFLNWIVICI